jgi:cytochrome c-type biogenesis protein CcmE
MLKQRHKRLFFICIFLAVLGAGIALILYAMNDYILYFKTPKEVITLAQKDYEKHLRSAIEKHSTSQMISNSAAPSAFETISSSKANITDIFAFRTKKWRLGGVVKKGSVRVDPKTQTLSFVVTGPKAEIHIQYTGKIPSLFREGQTVIVDGYMHITPMNSAVNMSLAKGFWDHPWSHVVPVFHASSLLAKHDENYTPPGMESNKKGY